jgi:hypothetical protein
MVNKMKTFYDLREAVKKPAGKQVFSKKVGKVSVVITKEKNKFCTYIDGEKLDEYRNQKEAEKAGMEFAKQYK